MMHTSLKHAARPALVGRPPRTHVPNPRTQARRLVVTSACPKTLCFYATGIHVAEFKSLACYSTLKIGGPARFLIEAFKEDDVKEAIKFANRQRLPYNIIGRGSNTLFSDKGYNGVAIVNRIYDWKLTFDDGSMAGGPSFTASCERGQRHAATVTMLEQYVKYCGPGTYFLQAGAGCPLNYLAALMSESGLGGTEFAVGIPGSVGGAVSMNAGAHGQEMSDIVDKVWYVNAEQVVEMSSDDLAFSYRSSRFSSMKSACITRAQLRLTYKPNAAEAARDLLARRQETQPVNARSAGCVFRNPSTCGKSAGQMIEECGLKDYRIGGASVSTKHANFLINSNNATAADFQALIAHVQAAVWDRFGVSLQTEIIMPKVHQPESPFL